MANLLNIENIQQQLRAFAKDRDWEQFHHPKNLAMALAAEAGELLEIFQWLSEAESLAASHDAALKAKTSEELADILLYLMRLADLMQIDLHQAVCNKMAINHKKYPADLVKGSAKKYTEY